MREREKKYGHLVGTPGLYDPAGQTFTDENGRPFPELKQKEARPYFRCTVKPLPPQICCRVSDVFENRYFLEPDNESKYPFRVETIGSTHLFLSHPLLGNRIIAKTGRPQTEVADVIFLRQKTRELFPYISEFTDSDDLREKIRDNSGNIVEIEFTDQD